MARNRSSVVLAGLLGALIAPSQAAPPPAEVFGRLPAIQDMAISADGTKIVVGINSGDAQAIRVLNLADGTLIAGARTPDEARLRDTGWADDDFAKFLISRTLSKRELLPYGGCPNCPRLFEVGRAGTLALKDGHLQLMMTENRNTWPEPVIFGPVIGDSGFGRMGAVMFTGSKFRYGLFRVNLHTGMGSLVSSYGEDTYSLLLDERGNVAVRAGRSDNKKGWRIYIRDGESERLLREETIGSGHAAEFDGMLPDGRLVRVDSPAGHDRTVVSYVNPTDNKEGILLSDPKFDIGGVREDPWTHKVIGASWQGELGVVQHYFDPEFASALALLKTALGEHPRIVSNSRDRKRMIVYAELPDDAGVYYLFEPQAKSLKRIGRTYPELPGTAIGETLAITYPARDGTAIPAYLTLPPGVTQPKNLPLIVLVHGGPSRRDTADFDYWAQFLASRGYLVLQSNFRGSSGYGTSWRVAGYKEWGGLMQTDVEDGADALARSGFADKARTCIMGASYGGYAALAGATLTPDRYACAVSVAGVSDLYKLMLWTRDTYGDFWYWSNTLGDPDTEKKELLAASPAQLAARVKIPVLLLHGSLDTVVPIEQTKDMLGKLQQAKKDVRFVELPGDDHWLSRPTTRTMMLAEIEKFLAEKLPAAPSERPVASLKPLKLPAGFSFSGFEASPLLEAGGTKGGDPLLALPGPAKP